MAIQMRRGALANYDETKMVAGEIAVTSEGQIFVANTTGSSKRILTEDDEVTVDSALNSTSENPVQNKVLKSALDAKAPKASPTFTGTPTAPTASTSTNNTQIATTAFVHNAVSAATKSLTATNKGSGVVELTLT